MEKENQIVKRVPIVFPKRFLLYLYRGCLIKTKINEAINYFRDEASGYL